MTFINKLPSAAHKKQAPRLALKEKEVFGGLTAVYGKVYHSAGGAPVAAAHIFAPEMTEFFIIKISFGTFDGIGEHQRIKNDGAGDKPLIADKKFTLLFVSVKIISVKNLRSLKK